MQIITIVRGKVPLSVSKVFESSYVALRGAGEFPPGLMQSFLLRSIHDPESYAIETIWESREVLDKMRNSPETPAAVVLFKKVGVTPSVEVNEMIDTLP